MCRKSYIEGNRVNDISHCGTKLQTHRSLIDLKVEDTKYHRLHFKRICLLLSRTFLNIISVSKGLEGQPPEPVV